MAVKGRGNLHFPFATGYSSTAELCQIHWSQSMDVGLCSNGNQNGNRMANCGWGCRPKCWGYGGGMRTRYSNGKREKAGLRAIASAVVASGGRCPCQCSPREVVVCRREGGVAFCCALGADDWSATRPSYSFCLLVCSWKGSSFPLRTCQWL